MKVFVAGATGVIGRALVPQLVARGHEVVGMIRSASKQELVRGLGARPVVADALEPDAVARAVASVEPEVIVHQLTELSGPMSMRNARHPDRSFAGRGCAPPDRRRPCTSNRTRKLARRDDLRRARVGAISATHNARRTRSPSSAIRSTGDGWCPHRDGYGSSLSDENQRCVRCNGTGLVAAHRASEAASAPTNGTADRKSEAAAWSPKRRVVRACRRDCSEQERSRALAGPTPSRIVPGSRLVSGGWDACCPPAAGAPVMFGNSLSVMKLARVARPRLRDRR
jgi:hypothetical protein